MSRERVEALTAPAGSDAFFIGGVSEERVRQVEELLGVRLPESYKWLLRQYGYGGVRGVEVVGVGMSEEPPAVVQSTYDHRLFGLPKPYIVVSDYGEWLYCLETDRMTAGECPVILWIPPGAVGPESYPDFFAYVVAEIARTLAC